MTAKHEEDDARRDLKAALRKLQAELERQNEIAEATVGISISEAQRAMADLISGQISGRRPRRNGLPRKRGDCPYYPPDHWL